MTSSLGVTEGEGWGTYMDAGTRRCPDFDEGAQGREMSSGVHRSWLEPALTKKMTTSPSREAIYWKGQELMDWKATQETIAQAIAKVVELEIETSIIDTNKVERKMVTKINLVQGDIKSSMDREFVVGELKELRAFHETQVLKAQQIIKDNLEALKTLWTLVKDASAD
jgi:hypothetical protein